MSVVVSTCCHASYHVNTDSPTTRYYICDACDKACDVYEWNEGVYPVAGDKPPLRCTWCMCDVPRGMTFCPQCEGSASLCDPLLPHRHDWSRQTLDTWVCKICKLVCPAGCPPPEKEKP